VENQASLRLAQEGRFGFAGGNLGAMLGLPATSNLTSDAIKFNAVAYPPSLITVCKIVNRLN
jgi:hypothetical protein